VEQPADARARAVWFRHCDMQFVCSGEVRSHAVNGILALSATLRF
jgi:hypothetical protein